MFSLSAALVAALTLGAPTPQPVRAAPMSAAPRALAMPGCPGSTAKVLVRCGSRTPTRGAVSVIIHECGGRIASIYMPGPADAPVKKVGVVVVQKARQAGQPDVWEGKGFSLWISGTHPMADGRDLAGLDTTLLGSKQSIELACQ